MRKTIILTLCCIAMSLLSCQRQKGEGNGVAGADSTLSLSYIQQVYDKDPARALLLADSAEQQGVIPSWRADSLRAQMCLDGYYDLNRSIEYALQALNNDTVLTHPQHHLNMLVMVSQIEVSLGRYSECIQFCDEGYALAEQLKDSGAACRLMVNAGYSMYFMKEKAKGLGYLLRTQKQLAKATDLPQLRTLSYCYGQLMNCLWIDNTDEAIRFGKLREALLDSIEHHFAPIPEGYLDKQRALTFSKMADFYAQKKDFQQARTYEQKFLATNLSKTARGNQLILDYYCTLGDFPRIQQTYHRSLPYWEHKDTFCSRYANVLGMLSDACTSQGLLQKALDYRTRQVRIKDSLIIHDNENEAIRLSAIYETHDKEIELEKKRADAQHYLLLAFSALVLFLLACAFAVYYYRQQIRMHRKNLLLISQMDTETRDKESSPRSQQLEVPIASTDVSATESATIDTVSIVAEPDVVAHTSTIPEYKSTPPNLSPSSQRRSQMVERFRTLIDDEHAYLQPDFSREKLQQMMNVSKNSLTPILHEALGDVANLSDYINSKRIAHACQLLRQQPQMNIDTIALESGFSTPRNFRRCFKSQTGMSPAEYRESQLDS